MKKKRGERPRAGTMLVGEADLDSFTERLTTALGAQGVQAGSEDDEDGPQLVVSAGDTDSLEDNTRNILSFRDYPTRHLQIKIPTSFGRKSVSNIVVQASRPYYFDGLPQDIPDMAKRQLALERLIPRGKTTGDVLNLDIAGSCGHAASLLNMHATLIYIIIAELNDATSQKLTEVASGLARARLTGIEGELVLEKVLGLLVDDKYSRVVSAGYTNEFFDKKGADARPRVWEEEGGSKPVRLQVKVKKFKFGPGLERFRQSIQDHRRKHRYTSLVSHVPLPSSFSRQELEDEKNALRRSRIIEGGEHLTFEAVHLVLAKKQEDQTLVLDGYPVLEWLDELVREGILWSWSVEAGSWPGGQYAKVVYEGTKRLRGFFALLAEEPAERIEEFRRMMPRTDVVPLKAAYAAEDREALRALVSKRITPPPSIPRLDLPLWQRKKMLKDSIFRFLQKHPGREGAAVSEVNLRREDGSQFRILGPEELRELKDDPDLHMQVRMVVKQLLQLR